MALLTPHRGVFARYAKICNFSLATLTATAPASVAGPRPRPPAPAPGPDAICHLSSPGGREAGGNWLLPRSLLLVGVAGTDLGTSVRETRATENYSEKGLLYYKRSPNPSLPHPQFFFSKPPIPPIQLGMARRDDFRSTLNSTSLTKL